MHTIETQFCFSLFVRLCAIWVLTLFGSKNVIDVIEYVYESQLLLDGYWRSGLFSVAHKDLKILITCYIF